MPEDGKGRRKELSLVSWNSHPPRSSFRDWAPDHGKMEKGPALTNEEFEQLQKAIENM